MTGQTIITGSMDLVGNYAPGEPIDAAELADGLRRLNNLVSGLRTQSLITLSITRNVFPLVANQQSYTIGTGGNFNVPRPIAVTSAGTLLNAADPNPVEVSRAVLTHDGYQAIQVKDLSNALITAVFYNPTIPLGTIFVWPNPNTAVHSLVLYLSAVFTGFADLTTDYDWPDTPGYAEMLEYQLAVRLWTVYHGSIPVPGDLRDLMNQATATVKRANLKISDLPNEAAWAIGSRNYGYDIYTDN